MPVETVQRGDEIVLQRIGAHVVSAVDVYPGPCPNCGDAGYTVVAAHDPRCQGDCVHCPVPEQEWCDCEGRGVDVVVVSYFSHEDSSYENRARDRRGPRTRRILVEKSIAQKRRGEVVVVTRGRPERADDIRATMEREQELRWTNSSDRMRHASARDRRLAEARSDTT